VEILRVEARKWACQTTHPMIRQILKFVSIGTLEKVIKTPNTNSKYNF